MKFVLREPDSFNGGPSAGRERQLHRSAVAGALAALE